MQSPKALHHQTRRANGPISIPLESFRKGSDSVTMRDALAELALRLIDQEDREEFRKMDGVTTLVDHLARIMEEQASHNNSWTSSQVFGTKWDEFEVHDSLQFSLIAICHASIDSDIALEMFELGALESISQVIYVLPKKRHDFVPLALECLRNLCCSDCIHNGLPNDFADKMWENLLDQNETSSYWQELAAEVLGNVAAISPSSASAAPEKLAVILTSFLAAVADVDCHNFAIALADLLCNLCVDPDLCLLLICELDNHRPRRRTRHSGVVYLAELTDKIDNEALKHSMESLVHNLSWSDPAGKRSVQKLALSSFMHRFAVEPAL